MHRPFLALQPPAPLPVKSVVALNVAVMLACALTGYAGLQIAAIGQSVTLFWAPAGIAFAALWLGGVRLVSGVLLGALLVNIVAIGAVPLALLVAVGNTLAPLVATLVLQRHAARYSQAGELARVLWFIFIAVLAATTLSATVGTLAVAGIAGIGSSVLATWLLWWMGDAMGVLIAAPPILLWRRFLSVTVSLRAVIDTLAFAAAGLGIISGLLLIDDPVWAVELCKLLTLLLSLWVSMRFGLIGPVAMTLLMAMGAVTVTLLGAGPFVRGNFYDSFALLHAYLFAEAVAGMLLAAALADLQNTAAAEASARAAADAASANRIRLLTMISHDVRTPLAGMAGAFDALADTRLDTDQARLVGLGQRSGHTLRTLVTDILDVARADSGRITLSPAPFDLRQSLSDIAAIHRPAAESKGLTLALTGIDALPERVTGDRARIEQLVGNLIVNAVAYTGAGGIILDAGLTGGGEIRIVVLDSGPGLPPSAVPVLFDAFTLLPRAGNRSAGLGLGLHISYRLAGLMGGTLDYAPGAGGTGSCFTFKAPLPRSPAAGIAARPDADIPLSILLVEDDPISGEITMRLLGALGHRVAIACTEADAVMQACSEAFDLVLMDMQLGDAGSGLDAARRIRDGAPTPPPIFGLTADGSESRMRDAIDAGLSGLIIKPIELGQGLTAALSTARFS